MLGNFGKLNALLGRAQDNARLGQLLDELLALAAQRAGGVAWEYYFPFGGGQAAVGLGPRPGHRACRRSRAPPRAWTAQAEVLPIAEQALGIFETRAAGGRARRRPAPAPTTRMYSFAPGAAVLNGFIQSLVGLYDYARLADDRAQRAVRRPARRVARVEVPTYDTGAWSLYSRGSVHARVRPLLPHAAARLPRPAVHAHEDPVYCDTARPLHRST